MTSPGRQADRALDSSSLNGLDDAMSRFVEIDSPVTSKVAAMPPYPPRRRRASRSLHRRRIDQAWVRWRCRSGAAWAGIFGPSSISMKAIVRLVELGSGNINGQ